MYVCPPRLTGGFRSRRGLYCLGYVVRYGTYRDCQIYKHLDRTSVTIDFSVGFSFVSSRIIYTVGYKMKCPEILVAISYASDSIRTGFDLTTREDPGSVATVVQPRRIVEGDPELTVAQSAGGGDYRTRPRRYQYIESLPTKNALDIIEGVVRAPLSGPTSPRGDGLGSVSLLHCFALTDH